MDIVLFGMQGSGKGTQGRILAKRHGWKVFETGKELRTLAQEDSPLGKKVKEIIEAGHLVPNEVVMEIIENFVSKVSPEDTVIFDGIPRKMEQAESFDALMEKQDREFIGLLIEISEDAALTRLTTRRICSKCKTVYPAKFEGDSCEECGGELVTRADDNVESIKTRLETYESETRPVLDRYKEKEKLFSINGEQVIEDVDKDVEDLLKEKNLT